MADTTKKVNGLKSKKNKLVVQKSHPLMYLNELTLAEFKILDVYLSRINSRDTDKRTVRFEKGELEDLIGVKRIHPEVLDKRIDNLMTNVNIPDESPKGYTKIALFEKTHLQVDDNGIWTAEMTCTEAARKYIFNIDEIGYIKYRLHSIIKLKSRYAYILFLYLEDNRYRVEWTIQLDELKELLNCEHEEHYKEYKRFNDQILKRIQKEIIEKTDCKYWYKPVKKGRSVIAIKFGVEPNNKFVVEDEDIEIPDENISSEELWSEAIASLGVKLEQEEKEEIYSILVTIPDYRLPQSSASYGNLELMRYHYLDRKVREILRRDKEKAIKNKYSYLIKIMKKDSGVD